MRNYNSIDLIRFHNLCLETGLKGASAVKKYNETYPELTAKQKLENLLRAMNHLENTILEEE